MEEVPQKSLALKSLFKGAENALKRVIIETLAGEAASDVARRHIEPVIAIIQENAGQEMSPLYLAYAIQYAINTVE